MKILALGVLGLGLFCQSVYAQSEWNGHVDFLPSGDMAGNSLQELPNTQNGVLGLEGSVVVPYSRLGLSSSGSGQPPKFFSPDGRQDKLGLQVEGDGPEDTFICCWYLFER